MVGPIRPPSAPPTGLGCQSAETRSGRHALGTVGDCAPRNLLVAQCRGLKVAFQSPFLEDVPSSAWERLKNLSSSGAPNPAGPFA